jgi:beta-glucanase (GH16 family)
MTFHRSIIFSALAAAPAALFGQATFGVPAKPVYEGAGENLDFKPSSDQVVPGTSAEGITVTIKPGPEGYPGLTLTKKDGSPFDLSKHGHVEARITNLGTGKSPVNLRLDNDGDWQTNPFNTESVHLEPGETGTIKLIFGHSYGHKKAFPLNPAAITRILFFGGKSGTEQVFRIDSLIAGGTPGELPPVDPATIRIQPENGVIHGSATKVDVEKQFSFENGATALVKEGNGIALGFPGGPKTGSVTFKPAEGRWDLSQYLQIAIDLENTGTVPVAPKIRIDTNGGPSETAIVEAIEPGKSRKVILPFASQQPWVGDGAAGKKDGKGSQAQPGSKVTSDAISKLIISVENIDSPRSLLVTSLKAEVPPFPTLPDWLGKKPPVDGDWALTFEDNFDGTSPNPAKWNIYAENYWDKASAFSKDNLIVEDGFAKLRYEKKKNHHNDDPKAKPFEYTTGFLDTYGKWTQRYGYFETRVKLPRSPGLWPAFWLMPDRGAAAGEKWKRQDTGNGAMEFDIVEHLTRWGPYRMNIAMHWDGYGKEHKAIGTSNVYVQLDKDGFYTAGLLWLPGQAVYYFNGEEVARWETERMSNVQSHLMYTLPQGGWDNNAIDDKQLPADFVIDYVRVWQRKDLATAEDGPKVAASPAQ